MNLCLKDCMCIIKCDYHFQSLFNSANFKTSFTIRFGTFGIVNQRSIFECGVVRYPVFVFREYNVS